MQMKITYFGSISFVQHKDPNYQYITYIALSSAQIYYHAQNSTTKLIKPYHAIGTVTKSKKPSMLYVYRNLNQCVT